MLSYHHQISIQTDLLLTFKLTYPAGLGLSYPPPHAAGPGEFVSCGVTYAIQKKEQRCVTRSVSRCLSVRRRRLLVRTKRQLMSRH